MCGVYVSKTDKEQAVFVLTKWDLNIYNSGPTSPKLILQSGQYEYLLYHNWQTVNIYITFLRKLGIFVADYRPETR